MQSRAGRAPFGRDRAAAGFLGMSLPSCGLVVAVSYKEGRTMNEAGDGDRAPPPGFLPRAPEGEHLAPVPGGASGPGRASGRGRGRVCPRRVLAPPRERRCRSGRRVRTGQRRRASRTWGPVPVAGLLRVSDRGASRPFFLSCCVVWERSGGSRPAEPGVMQSLVRTRTC